MQGRLYRIWVNVKYRANRLSISQQSLCYVGVTICKEWNTFEPFQLWALKNGYTDNLSIDRIKNNLGYSPDNCRWVTQTQQIANRRTFGKSVFRGVYYKPKLTKGWLASFVLYKPIRKQYYLGMFKTELEAALAYDNKAFDMLGSNARLNFPERFRKVG